jgi:mannose-6-phosphate isomerase-like protein (cupin superfamily)
MKFKHVAPRLFNAVGPLADARGSVSVLSRDRKGVVSVIKGLALGVLCSGMLWAASDPVDLVTSADLQQMTKKLAAESKRDGGGFAGETLKRYGNHLTMMAHREKSGSAELHTKDADIFMVVDGNATIVTGGKMVKAHTTVSGESRGTGIEGGITRKLAPGDVIHIAPNTPHQLKLEPGHTFTYFVVKVHS